MYQSFIQAVDGLTDEMIQRATPSVFAQAPHESRSSRYTPIPTSMILTELRNAGFAPTTAMQSRSRAEGKQDTTKHLLRFRRISDLGYSLSDVHEVVLVNSYDGSSSYNLYSGIFRIVCTNGLIKGDMDDTMRVRHTGNVVTEVVESTLQIADASEEVMDTIAEMKQIPLQHSERLLLAEYALKARFDLDDEEEEEKKKVIGYQPSDFLRVHRSEDRKNDLYTTMNVIQENMIKGKMRNRIADKNGQHRRTREIHGIDQSVKLNRLLWQFTEKLLELKQK